MLNEVAVFRKEKAAYPQETPFHPSRGYPEYPHAGHAPNNDAYEGVRECLRLLGLDRKNFGTPRWNPLGQLIRPGDKVLIKPNFVRHFHEYDKDLASVITHASVIRALMDYVLIATHGRGRLTIADAPQVDSAEISVTADLTGLTGVLDFFTRQGAFEELELLDLRVERALVRERRGVILERIRLAGDPRGYAVIELGEASEFAALSRKDLLRGSDYDKEETLVAHGDSNHRYLVSRSVLGADVVISVPKLKTHKRSGVTLNLKNMIGINGEKNWIPHFRVGSERRGGDEYPYAGLTRELENIAKDALLCRLYRMKGLSLSLCRYARKAHKAMVDMTGFARIRSGAWHGNDTLWRSIVDLNKVLFFADEAGVMRSEVQRRFFTVTDGIVAGENDGPLAPDPRNSGCLVAGFDPVAVDICATRLMGFDYRCVPKIVHSLRPMAFSYARVTPADIVIKSNLPGYDNLLNDRRDPYLKFKAPESWRGHLEVNSGSDP